MGHKQLGFLHPKSIRADLLFNFILVAILPTLAISVGSIIFGYYNARQNAVKRLDSLADLETVKINTWLENGQNELVMAQNEPFLMERIQATLQLGNKAEYYSFYLEGARFRMNLYLANTRLLNTISLVDLQGDVLLSTDKGQEGKNYQNEAFFKQGLVGKVTQIMNSPNTGAGLVIMTATPVVSLDGHLIGELAGQVKPESLAGLLQQGLLSDKEGRIFLVDRQNHLLDASSTSPLLAPSNTVPITAHSRGIVQALQSQTSGFLSYTNHLGKSVYGVYRWIPGLNESLLVEQDLAVVLTSIINNQVVNLLIIGAGILLAVSIAILTSRRIATPLASLVRASAEIAGGNLDQRVQVERQDEIGVLARAFNTMTAQLRSLITDLEARVRDRTAELQARNQQLIKRARQMETTSQVSREITSLLDVDSLLNRVVNLIQSSFAYYHVNIYLLDQASNRLVWRAGSGTVSPENQILEMKRISLNSKAAQENQAVLVNNIQQDPSFLADPNLPDTLSELVLPLRMGDQVMGTMDIHHSILGAFSPEDLTVLQGLGDQIAIAIHNAQLYEKNQALAVIEERSRMARELHDSISQLLYCQVLYADAGGKYFRAGQSSKALDYVDQLKVTANQALKEMRLMIYELRPSILESEGLLGAIRHRLETVECRSGVEAQLDGDPSLEIPQPIEKELYLIAQEALNNVLKHANARAVNVTLSKDNGDLVFTIRDDGIGFDPENIKSGLGLDNIRQHAQRMGGTITIISQPGQGTQLAIRIPGGQNDG